MSKAFRYLLLFALLFLYGCNPYPGVTVAPDPSEPEVLFQGNAQKEEVQTLAIDNCDGKSDLSRTEERSQTVDVTLSGEIAAKIGASAEVISAEVQAAVGAVTTQSASRSMSIQLTAPPKTHMQFQLVWTGNEQIGVVQNLRGANLPIAFRGFTPTDVRIRSQNDIGCPNSEGFQELVVTSEPVYATPRTVNSISEDKVAQLSRGQVSNAEVSACLDQAHVGPTPFVSFKEGDEVPGNTLIATNYGASGHSWDEFPVIPICYSGSWGLFRSNSAYIAPYEGAYWHIIP